MAPRFVLVPVYLEEEDAEKRKPIGWVSLPWQQFASLETHRRKERYSLVDYLRWGSEAHSIIASLSQIVDVGVSGNWTGNQPRFVEPGERVFLAPQKVPIGEIDVVFSEKVVEARLQNEDLRRQFGGSCG